MSNYNQPQMGFTSVGTGSTANYGFLQFFGTSNTLCWTANGTVGIGTAAPVAVLDVNGSFRVLSKAVTALTSGTGVDIIYSGGGQITSGTRGVGGALTAATMGYYASTHTFYTGASAGTTAVTINSSGQMGIGIATHSNLLTVSQLDANYSSPVLVLDAGIIGNPIAGAPRGIGKPLLGIGNSSYTVGGVAGDYYGIGFGYGGGAAGVYYPAEIGLYTQTSSGGTYGDIVFSTRSTTNGSTISSERLRITSTGTIGINATNPDSGYTTTIPNAKLTIRGGTAGQNGGKARLSIGADNSHYSAIEGTHVSGGATTLAFMTCIDAATNSANPETRLFINSSGNVGIGTVAPGAPLHVSAASNGSGGNGQLWLSDANNVNQQLRLFSYWSGGYAGSYGSINSTQVGNGATPLVLQATGGNVGIGTSMSPTSLLQVSGETAVNTLKMNAGGTAFQIARGKIAGGTGSGSVAFPFTFTNIPSVCCTFETASTTQVFSAGVSGVTTAGFNYVKTWNQTNGPGGAATSEPVFWIAIG
jgi:hypothetical protein